MKIRFGTFNLFQFCAPPYSYYTKKEKFLDTQWSTKLEWIKSQIVSMNCDIIGFQEVFSQDELKDLVFELGYKFFEVSEKPKIKDKKIYVTTTVAIASKFPIKNILPIKVSGKSIIKHNFEGHFKFQRVPIKATITLPNNQDIIVYIAHLKSNRLNEFEYIFTQKDTLEEKKTLVQNALKENYSQALKQRLCEASSLFFDIKSNILTPTVFMCDLNDREYSITIDALTNRAYHDNRQKKDSLLLYDAYTIFDQKIYNPHPEAKKVIRTPTSYYQGHGNIIDFIFVSKHFNKNSKDCIAKINSYEIFNKHLEHNHDGSLLQSDHAQVVCEVELIK